MTSSVAPANSNFVISFRPTPALFVELAEEGKREQPEDVHGGDAARQRPPGRRATGTGSKMPTKMWNSAMNPEKPGKPTDVTPAIRKKMANLGILLRQTAEGCDFAVCAWSYIGADQENKRAVITPWANIWSTAPLMPDRVQRAETQDHVTHVPDGRVADDVLEVRLAHAPRSRRRARSPMPTTISAGIQNFAPSGISSIPSRMMPKAPSFISTPACSIETAVGAAT